MFTHILHQNPLIYDLDLILNALIFLVNNLVLKYIINHYILYYFNHSHDLSKCYYNFDLLILKINIINSIFIGYIC